MKRCTYCKKLKSLDSFGVNRKLKSLMNLRCKTCINESTRKRYHANVEKSRERSRKEYAADPVKVTERKNKWRANHPDKIREYNQKYRAAHPEQVYEYTHNRYARKKVNGGVVTTEQWEALKRKYNYMCLRCKRYEPEIKLTKDHVISLKLGGEHSINNIQPLCGNCNSKKQANHIDYRQEYQ